MTTVALVSRRSAASGRDAGLAELIVAMRGRRDKDFKDAMVNQELDFDSDCILRSVRS